jgi:hypothetical protein
VKGIVAEINGKYAIILTKNGSFVKVKTAADMVIGQEIDMDRPSGKAKKTRLTSKIISIAAAGLLALGVGYAGYSYTLPYSYVHVDINPSIELTMNIYDRIIGAEALNSSGEELLNGSNLKNQKVDTAVKQLLNAAVQNGYLTGDEPQSEQTGQALDKPGKDDDEQLTKDESSIDNAVLLTVSSNNSRKSNELRGNIEQAAAKELEKEKVKSKILTGEASIEQRNDARRFGVTPGKLVLIEDALELKAEPAPQIEELKNASIKDLLEKASDKADKKAKREEQQAKERAKREEQQAKERAKREEQQAKERAKREEQQAKDKAKWEEQQAKDKAKWEEQQAKDKAKWEEQQAKDKAKREEQQAKDKAKREEQQAKEKAKQEEKKARENAKQSENKANSVKQNDTGKGSRNDPAQKNQTWKNNNQKPSYNNKKDEKDNSKKTQKNLKEEREKLRQDLLGQIKGRQDNYFGNQHQKDESKGKQSNHNSSKNQKKTQNSRR